MYDILVAGTGVLHDRFYNDCEGGRRLHQRINSGSSLQKPYWKILQMPENNPPHGRYDTA
jgi:hypothetical protein